MARSIAMDDDAPVFRAVVQITYRNGNTSTRYEGPYATRAAARARVTFWTNYMKNVGSGSSATGHVEHGVVAWRPLA